MVVIDAFAEKLIAHHITPSQPRVAILKYLIENQWHPTVDQIFISLRPAIPSLSKATVYNTLNAFIEGNQRKKEEA